MKRVRLDDEMVARGLCPDRDSALRMLMAGIVSSRGERLVSAGRMVRPGIELHVRRRAPYVGRGGIKLAGALDEFGVSPRGLTCADIGASTGGFTDCLLKRAARRVIAIDVGRAQFDWSLRGDPRVQLLERTNVIDVPELGYRSSCDLAVCDVSFTSVRNIIDAAVELLVDRGRFLALVKPQFEAVSRDVGRGGVVTRADVHRRVLHATATLFVEHGLLPIKVCASPIKGAKGNREFFLLGDRAMLTMGDPHAVERRLNELHQKIGEI
ncbi:hemolysin A [Coriobacterium glomerans PW2]|uniref:Hemolysin A n=1 Tax=Coriobacterium glomerans (strain ATCC 49209 / DSM 20642 / JCM 10262 / PW2) TaxID=700015 RepID=F2N7Z0_CORGP|nr:TlyA family RNA methyltransferase [Coriobacterium glomerans]AEB07099.1 hemolysin A [Coriobacterium glomerans PW2]